MVERELQCPLWEICLDKWKYYDNQKCDMLKMIANGEVSPRAVRYIEKEVNKFVDTK